MHSIAFFRSSARRKGISTLVELKAEVYNNLMRLWDKEIVAAEEAVILSEAAE